jgi:hypothetical protein
MEKLYGLMAIADDEHVDDDILKGVRVEAEP